MPNQGPLLPPATLEEFAQAIYLEMIGNLSRPERESGLGFDQLAHQSHLAAERFDHVSLMIATSIEDWQGAIGEAARYAQFKADARLLAERLAGRLAGNPDPVREIIEGGADAVGVNAAELRAAPLPEGLEPAEFPNVVQALARILSYTPELAQPAGDVAPGYVGDEDETGDYDDQGDANDEAETMNEDERGVVQVLDLSGPTPVIRPLEDDEPAETDEPSPELAPEPSTPEGVA